MYIETQCRYTLNATVAVRPPLHGDGILTF